MSSFYQLGGFRGHTTGWFGYDDDKLCQAVFKALVGDEKTHELELVLGILANGASYLLMTTEQMNLVRRSNQRAGRLSASFPASRYASLSPIVFSSASDLDTKVKTYNQKAKKKRSASLAMLTPGALVDTSQANRTYGDHDDRTRSDFEHQRVFWRLLHNALDTQKFCVQDPFRARDVVIRSLSFHTWDVDYRPREQSISDPKVLDIAWGDIPPVMHIEDYFAKKFEAVTLRVKENALLGLKGRQYEDYKTDKTKVVNEGTVADCLKASFKGHSGIPLVLLVHDAQDTLNVLQAFGVDTSQWCSGISSLLGYDSLRSREREQKFDRRRDEKYYNKSSRRSRSPPRRPSDHDDRKYIASSSSPRSSAHRVAPVLVVDVQSMYIALTKSGNNPSLLAISDALSLQGKKETWSAGNNCHLLVQIWLAMASGAAIDDQRVERWASVDPSKLEGDSTDAKAIPQQPDECNDECDPNDIPVQTAQSSWANTKQASSSQVYYSDDDDDDEY